MPAKERATKPASRKAPAAKRPAKKTPAKKGAAKKPGFGRPGTAGKAEGNAAVRAWIAAVKPEHRGVVKKLDALIGKVVPDVRRAIKWSTPLYGRTGIGYFASVASFKNYVSLSFFAGAHLDPPPPLGESEQMRRVIVHDMSEFDEARFRSWIEQAASRPGWGKL